MESSMGSDSGTMGAAAGKKGGSFFGVPRLFVGFAHKGTLDCDSVRSPTSPLEAGSCYRSPTAQRKVGLSIVESLDDDPKLAGKVFRFLDIKITERKASSGCDTAKSLPRNFTVFSPQCVKSVEQCAPENAQASSFDSWRQFTKPPEFLSAEEIELSEDYTCVISHGPNPKTTHIYGDCVLSRFGRNDVEFSSVCSSCKKVTNTYIYRSETSFCCEACCAEKDGDGCGEDDDKVEDNGDNLFEGSVFEV